jgi:hypothetical protein
VSRALQRLQEKVFADGAYYWAGGKTKRPRTVAELRKRAAEDGTHSILDMVAVSTKPEPASPPFSATGAAAFIAQLQAQLAAGVDLSQRGPSLSPMIDDDLIAMFGTTRPTHDMVEAESQELMERRGRGLGTYVVVFDGETPSEYFFTGISGD